jgi:hypothetical protein
MCLCANAVTADNISDKPNSVSLRFIRVQISYTENALRMSADEAME